MREGTTSILSAHREAGPISPTNLLQVVLTSQDDCGPDTQVFTFAFVNRASLCCLCVTGIKNVISYMGVTCKETKQPRQQRFGTQGLSLVALSSFLQTVLRARRCWGGL